MPISRREFESGELDPSPLIMEVLRSNPDYGYTLEELAGELTSRGVNLTEGDMRNVLRSLESTGRIESKTIRGVVYYICSRRIGFRPS